MENLEKKDFTENGTLIVGVEYKGEFHKDFITGVITVRDSFDAQEDCGEEHKSDGKYILLSIMAKRLKKLGTIPKEAITLELLLTLIDFDFNTIVEKNEALDGRLKTFRDKIEESKKSSTSPS